MWADFTSVDDQALCQLHNVANLPWMHGVAVLPDVHYGKGATVGSVIVTRDAVSLAAVGVNVGCGMSIIRTSLTAADLPAERGRLRRRIEPAVPVGVGLHRRPVNPAKVHGVGGWDRTATARGRGHLRFRVVVHLGQWLG